MPNYDGTRFDPPAPLALVTLSNPKSGANQSDVPMLIDSGADVTLVPKVCAETLGISADPHKRYEIVALDGSTSFAQVVQLDLMFLNCLFRGRFLLIDQEWGILGRNVLNAVSIPLDGPHLVWSEQGFRPD